VEGIVSIDAIATARKVTLAFAFVETGYAFKRQESVLLPSIHHKTMGRMGKGRI
jgi:hypothetical protein